MNKKEKESKNRLFRELKKRSGRNEQSVSARSIKKKMEEISWYNQQADSKLHKISAELHALRKSYEDLGIDIDMKLSELRGVEYRHQEGVEEYLRYERMYHLYNNKGTR